MGAMASQITSVSIVCSTDCSGADQREHLTSKLRVTGLCEENSPVTGPAQGPGTRKMFPFDDVIMYPLQRILPVFPQYLGPSSLMFGLFIVIGLSFIYSVLLAMSKKTSFKQSHPDAASLTHPSATPAKLSGIKMSSLSSVYQHWSDRKNENANYHNSNFVITAGTANLASLQFFHSQALKTPYGITTLRSRQNCRHFADDIFKCIFLNKNFSFLNNVSLKYVPKGLNDNMSALAQIMVCCRPGGKLLSEQCWHSLPTQICVTRPQCVIELTVKPLV